MEEDYRNLNELTNVGRDLPEYLTGNRSQLTRRRYLPEILGGRGRDIIPYPSRCYNPTQQQLEDVEVLSDFELKERCRNSDDSVLLTIAREHERVREICYGELRSRGILGTLERPPIISTGPISPRMMHALSRYKSQN